ncbi:MAG: hypothetical protein J1F40_08415, partial [Prevotellaceae bacterium]|nr:hypothetical protein [Prevotellaceae bacterium]
LYFDKFKFNFIKYNLYFNSIPYQHRHTPINKNSIGDLTNTMDTGEESRSAMRGIAESCMSEDEN